MFGFLSPEILCFGPQAQIFTFSKRRISEIPKNAIIPKVFKKNDIFAPKAKEKLKQAKNIEKTIWLIPPYSLKSLKTVVSDNNDHKIFETMEDLRKFATISSYKNPRIFVGKPQWLKSRNFTQSLGTVLLKTVLFTEIAEKPKILSS